MYYYYRIDKLIHISLLHFRLSTISLDYAEDRNTGQQRAFAVEMCNCTKEYIGLSCEKCNVGYTRDLSGLHLGTCIECSCNERSDECDPETGVCYVRFFSI